MKTEAPSRTKYGEAKASAIVQALNENGGCMSKACVSLGMARSTLYRLCQKYNIIWKKRSSSLDDFESCASYLGIQTHFLSAERPAENIYDDARAHASAICFLFGQSIGLDALKALATIRSHLSLRDIKDS